MDKPKFVLGVFVFILFTTLGIMFTLEFLYNDFNMNHVPAYLMFYSIVGLMYFISILSIKDSLKW